MPSNKLRQSYPPKKTTKQKNGGFISLVFWVLQTTFFVSLIQNSNHLPLLIGDRGFESHRAVHVCDHDDNGYRYPYFYIISYFDTLAPIFTNSDTDKIAPILLILKFAWYNQRRNIKIPKSCHWIFRNDIHPFISSDIRIPKEIESSIR